MSCPNVVGDRNHLADLRGRVTMQVLYQIHPHTNIHPRRTVTLQIRPVRMCRILLELYAVIIMKNYLCNNHRE